MRRFVAAVLGFLLIAGVTQAAELPIGQMLFKLGAPRASVIAEAQSRFTLVPVSGNPDMFFLSTGDQPHAKILGGIAFKNGRLSWVQRNWGNFTGPTSAVDVAKAVQSALASAVSASGSSATITTVDKQVPGTDFRSTYFQFPGHKVNISVTDSTDQNYGRQVTIDESISL